MLELGPSLDIDTLKSGAETTVIIAAQLTLEEWVGEAQLVNRMYAQLTSFGQHTLGRAGMVAVFGDMFLGSENVDGDYSQPVSGLGSGLAGWFEGVCSVYLDEEITVSELVRTNVVPALEFRIADVTLVHETLGIAQLFPKVAVPLIGQSPAVFQLV